MRKIIDFFKRLWRLITGQEVRPYVEPEEPIIKTKKLLGGSSYDFDIDYTDIYNVITNCKTVKGLQKECKKFGITIDTDLNKFNEDKTAKLKTKHLYELIKVYSKGVAEQYKNAVNSKLQEIKPLMDRRIKELRLQGLKYDPDIDYVDIYDSLVNCRTPEGMQKECKERGIMISTDVKNISPNKTVQLKCEELLALLKLFGQGASEPFKKALETKIEEFELLKNKRIEDLESQGLFCHNCNKGKLKKHYHGLCEVFFKSDAGGALGGGSNAPYVDSNEYQIHYKKCDKCDYIDIFEYRFVPSWFADLFNLDRPFYPGSPVNDYKPEHYIKYKITRW